MSMKRAGSAGIVKYVGWLLVAAWGGMLLSACTPSPQEYALERTKLAKFEDTVAECRLFTQNKEASKLHDSCLSFLEKDADCMVFPEQKEHCVQLLRAQDYTARKQECAKFSQQERSCAALVEENGLLSWFRDVANSAGLEWKKKTWNEFVLEQAAEIHIGVVWAGPGRSGEGFRQGLELAIDQVNEQGGVLGRKLVTHQDISGGDLRKSRQIADKMSADTRIRVVVGRDLSTATIPVTAVYESSDIVYLAVSATNNNVIRYGMQFIFRQIPNNDHFAAALIKFCGQQNYANLGLLYSRDSYSEDLAYAFRDYAINNNLKIAFEKSFFDRRENFVDIAADIKKLKLDVIFLATLSNTAVRVVDDLRGMKIEVPIIGSDSLDSSVFIHGVGVKGNGLVVPTVYNPFSVHLENAEFTRAFHQRYGVAPDTWAAQGYDAIKLLAHVMGKEVRSTVPANIATGLRYMQPQNGTTGTYTFDVSGELLEKPIYFKELQNEEFILFKDTKQEEEQTQQIEIVDERIIRHPEKPSESMEAMSVF